MQHRGRVRLSLQRGFSIAFATSALVVVGACISLLSLTNVLRSTTSAVGDAVARHEMAEDCHRDRLLREHARSDEMRARIDGDIDTRLRDLRARTQDDEARRAVDAALAAIEREASGDAGARMAAGAALARLESLERGRVAGAQAEAERWHRIAASAAALTAIVVIVGAGLLLWIMHRQVVVPLSELARCMRGSASADLAHCPVAGPEEVRDVGRAFNALSTKLRTEREAHTTFLAGVAHDLRNPIQVLRTAVDLSEDGGSAKVLDVIGRQLVKLERLVGDLLDTTTLEAGRLKLEMGEHDLRDIARGVHRLVSVASHDVKLALVVPPEPVIARCDGSRIEQVLLNVVNNAIKYSPREKDVAIEVASTPDRASLFVRDHGAGMSEREIESVFDPYARVSSATNVRGHGLGLYLARRIVEQHGGAIRVESSLGRGSTFRIDIPRGAPHVNGA